MAAISKLDPQISLVDTPKDDELTIQLFAYLNSVGCRYTRHLELKLVHDAFYLIPLDQINLRAIAQLRFKQICGSLAHVFWYSKMVKIHHGDSLWLAKGNDGFARRGNLHRTAESGHLPLLHLAIIAEPLKAFNA